MPGMVLVNREPAPESKGLEFKSSLRCLLAAFKELILARSLGGEGEKWRDGRTTSQQLHRQISRNYKCNPWLRPPTSRCTCGFPSGNDCRCKLIWNPYFTDEETEVQDHGLVQGLWVYLIQFKEEFLSGLWSLLSTKDRKMEQFLALSL